MMILSKHKSFPLQVIECLRLLIYKIARMRISQRSNQIAAVAAIYFEILQNCLIYEVEERLL